jgi:hypothetical protein
MINTISFSAGQEAGPDRTHGLAREDLPGGQRVAPYGLFYALSGVSE